MTQEEFFKRYTYSIRTDKVGGGAFGTVYKAFDEELNREVAIKVSEVKIIGDKEFSLKDEFDAIKDVPVQRNIANYEELFTFEGPQGIFDYAIMQFYKDGNLSNFIKGSATLAQKEQVALDLLEGIHHLHKHSVVHRDLKPGNILIVKRGAKTIPVITDFGLSKNAKMEGQSRFSNSFGGGTLKYSSPEQLKAERLRLNTDLWAYGVIVYEIFTGKNLFMAQEITGASAEAEKEIYEQIIGVDISEKIKELPIKWQEVVKLCLVRDGAKRIKTTQALKDLILKGETFTESATSLNDDKTLISKAASEEFMDAKTVVNNRETNQKEAVKKRQPKKVQPEQGENFQSKQSFTESKKVENKKRSLIFVGVIIGLLVISGFVYTMLPSESNDWEEAQKLNTQESYSNYIENNPEGAHVTNAKEYLLWFSVKDDESIDSLDVYLNKYPNGFYSSKGKELKVWMETIDMNTIESYRLYLETYPLGIGVFREEAENKLILLNDENASKEDNAWNKAKTSNTITSYTSYIKTYKKGKHIKDANYIIKELKKKAEDNFLENYKKGKALYDKRSYLKAAKYFIKSAEQGHIESQHYMGESIHWACYGKDKIPKNLLSLGEGRPVATAMRWLKKAANQEYVPSYLALALIYEQGISFDNKNYNKDHNKALTWYLKAAEAGDDEGIYGLVLFYKYYLKNIEKAKYWIEKYPKNKNSQTMYRYGTFEDRPNYSLRSEYDWLLKSAESGYYYHTCKTLAYAYRDGNDVLDSDLDKSFDYFEKMFKNEKRRTTGSNWGLQGMATIYEKPEFVNYNLKKALNNYKLIIESGVDDINTNFVKKRIKALE